MIAVITISAIGPARLIKYIKTPPFLLSPREIMIIPGILFRLPFLSLHASAQRRDRRHQGQRDGQGNGQFKPDPAERLAHD